MKESSNTRKVLNLVEKARDNINEVMAILEADDPLGNAGIIQDLDFHHEMLNDYVFELEGDLYGVPTVEDWE